MFALKELKLSFEHVAVFLFFAVCTISVCCCYCRCCCCACYSFLIYACIVFDLLRTFVRRVKIHKTPERNLAWDSQCIMIIYWSCMLNFACVYCNFHGACSFNDCATCNVCVCVSVMGAHCFFLLLYLRMSFWIFPLFRLHCILRVDGVQPATSQTIEYRIPYKRCVVLRSNHQFLVHPQVFNTSYSIFIRKSSQQTKKKNSTQNVQIGEYLCIVFVCINHFSFVWFCFWNAFLRF